MERAINMNKKDEFRLYNHVISEQNIYNAIYGLNSYIFEKGLLSKDDLELYYKLQDKYDFCTIDDVIEKCKNKLEKILLKDDELFEIEVFFKMKKYKDNKVSYRPIHTADLITQICIVALLNIIVFEDKNDKRELSDVSELIPSNFYGNIPSTNVRNIFFPWKEKYKEYTKKVVDTYNLCEKTGKYKYEVYLDLKNFFPTVDPNFIYCILLDKLKIVYERDNERLKIILKKLLFFNIKYNKEWVEEYYGDNYKDDIFNNEIKYTPSLGIPQGLPQSYYFGNICMGEIAKKVNEFFPGEAFYYVDDSVIYTNDENAKAEKFKESIKNLNECINDYIKSKITEECINYEYLTYKIQFHEEEKSISTDIQHTKKYGRSFLREILLGASTVTIDIATTVDDLQDETIKDKVLLYLNSIKKEIELMKYRIKYDEEREDESKKAYLKLLYRYKKFFKYRFKMLSFIKEDYTDEELEKYFKKYEMKKDKYEDEDYKKIFSIFEEDIFSAEAALFLRYSSNEEIKEKIISTITTFENKISQKSNINNLYFSKVLKQQSFICYEFDRYKTIKKLPCRYLDREKYFSKQSIFKIMTKIIIDFNNKTVKEDNNCFEFLGYKFKNYMKFIITNSNEMKREILNCIFSRLFSVDINDKFIITKNNGRTLEYYELRILVYIRNLNSVYENIIDFIKNIISRIQKEYLQEKIDYSIIEVLDIFITYVKNPEFIDNLINTHKYVMSVWKNGSKHLYFYTLHNQEHSVELISSCVSICKSIDFFKIKSIDYYVLFLACYFHDISMIIQPDINIFLSDDNDAKIILNEWKIKYREVEKCNSLADKNNIIMQMLVDFYKRMDEYFENTVRSNHVKQSANFIRVSNDLDYIEPIVRDIVAKVSESHGFNDTDVYGLKSNGECEAVNIKFLMILLRLADLMDMSKDRVSVNIMKLNIEQMSKVSQFHWISHAAIDMCNIKSKYEYKIPKSEVNTYLDKDFFVENCEIHLYLNTQNLMAINNLNKCKSIECKLNCEQNEISLKMLNKSDDNDVRCDKECNFMCKWMNEKNYYLINELKALDRYLSRNQENNFTTNFYIKIHMENTSLITLEYLEKVLEYIT